eukprot:9485058-Pyramimonas_sp.AAC.1
MVARASRSLPCARCRGDRAHDSRWCVRCREPLCSGCAEVPVIHVVRLGDVWEVCCGPLPRRCRCGAAL